MKGRKNMATFFNQATLSYSGGIVNSNITSGEILEVLSVTKKGKVTAKKKGTSMVYAKVGKKKLSCKVTVKKQTVTQAPQEAPTIIPIPWDLPI